MKQMRMVDKNPIEFQSTKLTNKRIDTINQNLHEVDWNRHLNSDDCNVNFNRFCDILHTKIDEIAMIVQVKISGKRGFTKTHCNILSQIKRKVKTSYYINKCINTRTTPTNYGR